MFDVSVRCYESTHLLAAGVAIGLLAVMVVIIPAALVTKVRQVRWEHDKALLFSEASGSEAMYWFKECDDDASGFLSVDEVRETATPLAEPSWFRAVDHSNLPLELLSIQIACVCVQLSDLLIHKMNHRKDKVVVALSLIDKDGDGKISASEFERWYEANIMTFTKLGRSALDILFDTVNPNVAWWFLHDLWMKFTVNILYTFGYFGTFDWHIYVNVVVAASVGLNEYYRCPFSARFLLRPLLFVYFCLVLCFSVCLSFPPLLYTRLCYACHVRPILSWLLLPAYFTGRI